MPCHSPRPSHRVGLHKYLLNEWMNGWMDWMDWMDEWMACTVLTNYHHH